MLSSWSSINASVNPFFSASCFDKVQIIYKPDALVSHGTEFGLGLLNLEIVREIPFSKSFGSKYVPHSQVAIATWIFVFCAEIAIISLPLQATGLT